MRSKSYTLLLASTALAALLLSACTLSMEDYTIPEEERGFDEPIVVENEFGTVSYQFNQGVQSLTPNIQKDYVVTVEDDSVLYFMDNTPEKYLPKVGGLIAATCTHKIPLGLEARVLSVTPQNGMYRVVTTRASVDEIYQDLEVKLEMDYEVPNRPLYDSIELAQKGIDIEDLAQVDMTLIDEYYGEPDQSDIKPRQIRRHRTRAESDGDSEGKKTDKDTTITHVFDFELPIGSSGKTTFKGKLTLSHNTVEHYYYESSKKKDYRKEYTDDASSTKIGVRLGVEQMLAGKVHDGDQLVGKNIREVYQKFSNIISRNDETQKKNMFQKAIEVASIKVPIPGTTFYFVAGFNASVSLKGEAYGELEATIYHKQTRVGYIYNKGEKTKINQILENGRTAITKAAVGGNITVEGNVSAGLGVEHASGVGATVNLGLTAGLNYNFDLGYKGNGVSHCTEATSVLTAYIDVNIYAELYFSPAGIKLFGAKKDIWKKRLYHWDSHFIPVINRKASGFYREIIHPAPGTNLWQYTVHYCFKSIWPLDGVFGHQKQTFPMLRVYYNSLEGEYRDFIPEGPEVAINTEDDYTFVFNQNDISSGVKKIICVPCIYDRLENTMTVLTSVFYNYEDREPQITYVKGTARMRNVRASEAMDAESFQQRTGYSAADIDKFYQYELWSTFNFKQTESIAKWGYHVQIETPDDTRMADRKKLIYSVEETGDPDVYTSGYVEPGNKTVMLNFITAFAPKQPSEAWTFRMRVYIIDFEGKEKNSGWTNWMRMDCPYDNISNMSKSQKKDAGEGYGADI